MISFVSMVNPKSMIMNLPSFSSYRILFSLISICTRFFSCSFCMAVSSWRWASIMSGNSLCGYLCLILFMYCWREYFPTYFILLVVYSGFEIWVGCSWSSWFSCIIVHSSCMTSSSCPI